MKLTTPKNRSLPSIAVIAALWLCLGDALLVRAQQFALVVPGTNAWMDTGIDIEAGSLLSMTATGVVSYGTGPGEWANAAGIGPNAPDGWGWLPPPAVMPGTAGYSLVGKIGGGAFLLTGTPVPGGGGNQRGPGWIGTNYAQVIPTTGRLFLGYNESIFGLSDNSGSFQVRGKVVPPPQLSIRCSQVQLCWQSVTSQVYQVQFRSALSTNQWLDLGSSVWGDGTQKCASDAVAEGQPQRYYRVTLRP